ncbi:DMT family transporter [Phytoactinopolyspora mesophila]|uniref:EamA family transporter n=1 Tax=Phytoactinopolyspora mesophila TaxID=2650750 RepID=A0A7K3M8T7_9ACTN|nr:DMT family transporter [Phytoactinopolyspora mesophila]NDL59725.1 EamA family transporter [Phytoactinopolyspora mesophila]
MSASVPLVPHHAPSHVTAILQGLLVTFLWSTSWVLIKTGLEEIPALTFAGLRYVLAFLCLLPFVLRARHLDQIRVLGRRDWVRLVALGLVMYTATQGAQFLALDRLPATTTSLLLSFTPVVVALLGIAFLAETPRAMQWVGVAMYLVGAALFLYPVDFPAQQLVGIGIAVVGLIANAAAAVLGRSANRGGALSPLVVTVVSMGIGSVVLLVSGVATQGLPTLSASSWAIVGWLAVVNTAFAFTLWNLTLRTLSATESSIVNQTMLIQIAILAWIFLDESLGVRQIAGLAVAALGMLIVQLRHLPSARSFAPRRYTP